MNDAMTIALIKSYIKKYSPGGTTPEAIVQSDWNQNDSTAKDYIKNRPFYDMQAEVLFDDEVRMEYGMDDGYFEFKPRLGLVEGETYTIIRDNGAETLTGVCVKTEYYRSVNFGNGFGGYNVVLLDGINNDTRFIISYPNIMSFHLKITHGVDELKKLDTKYLPFEVLEPADWNQNDPTAKNYVKNRPFYDSREWECVHEAQSIQFTYDQENDVWTGQYPTLGTQFFRNFGEGTVCKLVVDGVEYVGVISDNAWMHFGNSAMGKYHPHVQQTLGPDTGEDFVVVSCCASDFGIVLKKAAPSCEISVFICKSGELKKIESKYLPKYPDWSHLTWYIVGDSLTDRTTYDHTRKFYYEFIQEKTGINIIVDGKGGTGYKAGFSDNISFLERVQNAFPTEQEMNDDPQKKEAGEKTKNVDIVTIFGSGNDIVHVTDLKERKNAIFGTLSHLANNRPGLRVIVVPPPAWLSVKDDEHNVITNYDKRGELWKPYCDDLQLCALACDFRYLSDMYDCPPYNPNFAGHLEKFFGDRPDGKEADGIHPNTLGHEALAQYFYNALNQELSFKM